MNKYAKIIGGFLLGLGFAAVATIETATYTSDLNATYPAAGDLKSEGDDHIRLLKSTIKATFANITGAVTATHTELNYVAGVTSAIQTQINTKAPAASPVFTGQVSSPLGAVGAPTYTFTGDLDTGFWSPAANTLAASTSGAESWRVLSTGELLVARTATFDAAYKLQVGDGSGNTRALFNSNTTAAVAIRNGASTNGVFSIGASASPTPDLLFTNTGSTELFRMTTDGRIYGTALHNNSGSVSGASFQYIASGTYTPTPTSVANLDATPTAGSFQWLRVGNVVTVSGRMSSVDPSVTGTTTTFRLTLPIASTLANTGQCAGTVSEYRGGGAALASGTVQADVANGAASVTFSSNLTTAAEAFLTFTYVVL